MKKRYVSFQCLALIILFGIYGIPVQAQSKVPIDINAEAWVVMNQHTGDILFEKNMDKPYYPASITKIATTIFAIEQGHLNEIVTVSETAAQTKGSSLYLKQGDKLPLRDLLYGIMLHSGNDGAVTIAEHLSKNERQFARQMTHFLKSIGANNTHFVNASGLPNDQHYTTAYDMAIITRYAMKNPIFRDIVSHQTYRWNKTLWRNNLREHERTDAKKQGIPWTGEPQVVNHNRLLTQYKGAIGVKNGFTHEAQYTLVGSARRNDTELIAVILKSDNIHTAYNDTTKLLNHGFSFKKAGNEVLKKNKSQVKKISLAKTPTGVANETVLLNPFLLFIGLFMIVIGLYKVKRRKS